MSIYTYETIQAIVFFFTIKIKHEHFEFFILTSRLILIKKHYKKKYYINYVFFIYFLKKIKKNYKNIII